MKISRSNLIQIIQEFANTKPTYAEFREKVYETGGLIDQCFKDQLEKQEFFYSPEYQQINKIAYTVMNG